MGLCPLQRITRGSVATISSTDLKASQCGQYDFDVAIIGCGVGGHGAALHARGQKLETAVFVAQDIGGTCVNRGCVPSKALLAAAGRVREMQNAEHLASMGITVGDVQYDRAGIANHANGLANRVKGNLEASLKGLGVQIVEGRGVLTGNAHEVKDSLSGKVYTAKVSAMKMGEIIHFIFNLKILLHVIAVGFASLSCFLGCGIATGHHFSTGQYPLRSSWNSGRRKDRVHF